MKTDMLTRSGAEAPYVRDILEQAHVLAPAIDRMAEACRTGPLPGLLNGGSFDRFILTGMGSSFWALHPLYLRLIEARRNAWLVETSELLYHSHALLEGERTLVIAASQSGASAETVRLLDDRRGRLTVIGLTNEPEGPLARRAAAAMVFAVGPEATVSCKTYTACLAGQSLLGDLLLGAPPDSAPLQAAAAAIADYLGNWPVFVKELAAELGGIRQVYLTGRGASLAAACTGGLTIKESTHVPAEGMSCAAFRHGPLEMTGPETFVVVFAGSEPTRDLNIGLHEGIRHLGGKTALVRQDAAGGAWRIAEAAGTALPMLEILPVQMLTLALAKLRGRTAGEFSFSSKVTAKE